MPQYRFVCVDGQGRWRDVRYANLPGDAEAKGVGHDLLREFVAILVYQGEQKIVMLAQVA